MNSVIHPLMGLLNTPKKKSAIVLLMSEIIVEKSSFGMANMQISTSEEVS